MKIERCGKLSRADIGREVTLAGWVHRRRDLGGLVFIDLRDSSGIVQLIFNPDLKEAHLTAHNLSREDVIWVRGVIAERGAENVNPKIPTGEIEIKVQEMKIINKSKTPPFSIDLDERNLTQTQELIRLEYRYLDLRRPMMQRNIRLRHHVLLEIRNFFNEHGFLEIETPMLTKSTPEGARDYLVPSRTFPGKFYALPQSPQLFKQLLVIGGFERYFQIVRCFRDEDLRADRQPEFTQLDLEMGFIETPQKIMELIEGMMERVFEKVLGVTVKVPFPKLKFGEAIERYGTDKPDLRFGMELVDLTKIFKGTEFRIFAQAIKSGGVVKGICAGGCALYPRSFIDQLERKAIELGAKGLIWIKVKDSAVESPVAKHLEVEGIKEAFNARPGDLLLLLADERNLVNKVLGELRLEVAKSENLYTDEWKFVWITDFPLLEWSGEENRLVSQHHPFTMPKDLDLLEKEPLKVSAEAYDLVLNGVELGTGSIRIHRRDLQEKIFRILGLSPQEVEERFGFFLRALEYGAPPHGGIALGLDRLIMLMAGANSLRDVIVFPKTNVAYCPLTGAPMEATKEQLEELGIAIKENKKEGKE